MILRETLENIMNFTYKVNKSKVACRAILSSAQSVATGGFVKLNLNNTMHNPGSYFDTSTYRFDCPVDGRYLCIGNVSITNLNPVGASLFTSVYKNGSELATNRIYTYAASGDPIGSVSTIADLNANDYLELYCYHNSGVNENVSSLGYRTFLAVELLAVT